MVFRTFLSLCQLSEQALSFKSVNDDLERKGERASLLAPPLSPSLFSNINTTSIPAIFLSNPILSATPNAMGSETVVEAVYRSF